MTARDQNISELWREITSILSLKYSTIQQNLQPGASESTLAVAEAALGIAFPESLTTLYRFNDGEGEMSEGCFGGWQWLSLERLVAWHRELNDLEREFPSPGYDVTKAIPLFYYQGEYLYLDMSASQEPTLLLYSPESPHGKVAESLYDFLLAYQSRLASDAFVYQQYSNGKFDLRPEGYELWPFSQDVISSPATTSQPSKHGKDLLTLGAFMDMARIPREEGCEHCRREKYKNWQDVKEDDFDHLECLGPIIGLKPYIKINGYNEYPPRATLELRDEAPMSLAFYPYHDSVVYRCKHCQTLFFGYIETGGFAPLKQRRWIRDFLLSTHGLKEPTVEQPALARDETSADPVSPQAAQPDEGELTLDAFMAMVRIPRAEGCEHCEREKFKTWQHVGFGDFDHLENLGEIEGMRAYITINDYDQYPSGPGIHDREDAPMAFAYYPYHECEVLRCKYCQTLFFSYVDVAGLGPSKRHRWIRESLLCTHGLDESYLGEV